MIPYALATALLERLGDVLTECRSAAVALRDISDVLHAEYYQHHSDPVSSDPADDAWAASIDDDARSDEEKLWELTPSSPLWPHSKG